MTTTGSTRATLPPVRCVRCYFPSSSFSRSVVRDGLSCGHERRRRRRNEIVIIRNALNNGEASLTRGEEEEEEEDDKEDKKDAEIVQINERFHWSKKLQQKSSAETTRDDLRMMPKRYFDEKKNEKKKKTVTSTENASFLKMQKVHRDRDTSIMVTDEQLQREFREELGEKNLEDSTTRSMRERLFLLLPSLRENSANNERLVEDLLVRVGLERVSSRLLSMRKIFPACDVAEMASKNPKVYLSFSSSGNSVSNTSGNDDDDDAEKEWHTEIEKLKDMFPFAGQNGLPSVDRMVQAVPQFLDSQFVQRSIQALIFSGIAKDELDAKTKLHQNPRLVLNVESASNRSRFESASHFDQTNVKKNKVVYDDNDDAKREAYYDVAS